ncbi:hypothetical protein BJF90_14385 [Pseudonocardia sp. CNS-004]|nr:hypothetical protein BJF90_14385 [Pseudonocardia sp. CNS-004]
MEPVTLIAAALAAGVAAGAQDTAAEAVKDAYNGLKTLVGRRLAGRSDDESVLERLELRRSSGARRSRPNWSEPMPVRTRRPSTQLDG